MEIPTMNELNAEIREIETLLIYIGTPAAEAWRRRLIWSTKSPRSRGWTEGRKLHHNVLWVRRLAATLEGIHGHFRQLVREDPAVMLADIDDLIDDTADLKTEIQTAAAGGAEA